MPSASRPLYNFLFRKNYVFLGAVFASAFGFEMAYDSITDRVWDSLNKGRQWKDIRSRYVEAADDE
ncbi:4b68a89e-0e88-4422-8c72-b6f1ce5cce34 [Sclerotinia trifoliorum]|uniref:Complex III subunit 9 n=1 Tax=Sclerotinia trifoliorum TaxID=28548 RepID=A0A8H2VL72_9HELO|nr:4b68a89e-0e88-4422-8c72-b6f1ce5cce34 [Sclerotinia trifoliorum]